MTPGPRSQTGQGLAEMILTADGATDVGPKGSFGKSLGISGRRERADRAAWLPRVVCNGSANRPNLRRADHPQKRLFRTVVTKSPGLPSEHIRRAAALTEWPGRRVERTASPWSVGH